ncbi:MAG TPA: isoprenylcysteine carboxylmethyltransferase family protein [Gemmatimonadales bacterium]|jgi:protein-S-isoprenylcysteine O-methyltransferase Ste14|nr:isoprenylcysteine carboxylmethyltransferase family protein [Gemmatimonadales bacterium]
MGALARAITYSTFFVGFLLVFLPTRVLEWSGIRPPPAMALPQVAGFVVGLAGAVLAVSCILTFALVGKGTPAPFDPPRRLVTAGPYRYLRNPMYLGAGLALLGAALYYRSVALLAYVAAFLLVAHVFVVSYEEPTLRRLFGPAYESYCGQTGRWLPGKTRRSTPTRSGGA